MDFEQIWLSPLCTNRLIQLDKAFYYTIYKLTSSDWLRFLSNAADIITRRMAAGRDIAKHTVPDNIVWLARGDVRTSSYFA